MKDIEQIGTQIENEIAQVVTEAVEPPTDTPPAPKRKTKLTERTAAKVTAFLLLMEHGLAGVQALQFGLNGLQLFGRAVLQFDLCHALAGLGR